MAFGATLMFVLAVTLQVAVEGAWPREAGRACAWPGALREEPSGALRVCAAAGDGGGFAWTPAGGATGGATRGATPRAAPDCAGLAGQWRCDSTCAANGVCLNDGQWLYAQNCSASGLVCLNNTCTTGSLDNCPSIDNMQCMHSGTYPSLVDCSLYYTCDSSLTGIGKGKVQSCPAGLFYDACLKVCAITASDTCSWAVSNPCAAPGTIGVAPNNDRLYYVCLLDTATNAAYPLWRTCTTGHFSLTTLTCERTEEPGCGSTTTTQAATTTEPTSPETTPTPTPKPTETTEDTTMTTTTETTTAATIPPPFECKRPGINANPATNCSFYYCYNNLSFVLLHCANGYHFDEASAGCILGQCTP